MFVFPKPYPWPFLQLLVMLPPLVFISHVFFARKEQGESCEGSILVNINQLIILLPLLQAILKICLFLALLHITQLLILLLCLSLVFLNITTQMGGHCRTRVHHGVV